jgi:hypothetical protein
MSGRGRSVWAAVAAVAVGIAVGFGIGAIAFGGGSSGGGATTTTISTKPIQLPAALGGLRDLSSVFASKSPGSSAAKQASANEAKDGALTIAAYSRAYGGAAAAYRVYTDSSISHQVYLIAVRSGAPGLTIGPVIDPASLGLATPEQEVKQVGPVSCAVDWNPVAAGNRPQPSDEHIAVCERTGPGVTVFVGGGGYSGPAGLQTLSGLADQGWSAVSGG